MTWRPVRAYTYHREFERMAAVQESVCKFCPHREDSIFSDLTEVQLDTLCHLKLVNHYKEDQRIFYEGEPNLGIFILCSGKAKLSRSSKVGRKQITGIVGPCGLLEEKDLFLKDRRTVTAEAMEDSTVCFVKREDFLEFLKQNPPVAVKMIGQLSRELEQAEEKIAALTEMDVKRRLADLLVRLGERYGEATPEGRRIELALTREEMAEMVGTTQETVIRVLSGFKKKRLIKDFEKKILLIHEERLRRIAG